MSTDTGSEIPYELADQDEEKKQEEKE